MKKIFVMLCLSLPVLANEQTYILKTAEVSYTVNFPLKTVIGKSTDMKGKGLCAKNNCEFLVAGPVKSFKSGDTNRDVHMLEVTKASQHPLVSVNAIDLNPDKLNNVSLEIDFAGVKKTITGVHLNKTTTGSSVEISARIPILLSDFKIERPTLLGVAIDDKVDLNIKTQWDNQ